MPLGSADGTESGFSLIFSPAAVEFQVTSAKLVTPALPWTFATILALIFVIPMLQTSYRVGLKATAFAGFGWPLPLPPGVELGNRTLLRT